MRGYAVSALIFSALFSTVAVAQVDKGDIEIDFSGRLGWSEFSGRGLPGGDFRSIGIGIGASLLVTQHVGVGGTFGASYSESRSKASLASDSDSYTISLGPGARYHFRPTRRVVPFVGGAFVLSRTRSATDFGRITTDRWFAQMDAGADFFLNDFVSVKLTVQYGHQDEETESSSPGPASTSSSDVRGVTSFVGFSVFL